MPNLPIGIDETALNTNLIITASKAVNSFKFDDFLSLSIDNLSDNTWSLSIEEDILIFQYKNNEWIKVQDKSIHLGEAEITLGKAGNFPTDRTIISMSPAINSDFPVALRIFVFAHEEFGENITGAFVDVYLKP